MYEYIEIEKLKVSDAALAYTKKDTRRQTNIGRQHLCMLKMLMRAYNHFCKNNLLKRIDVYSRKRCKNCAKKRNNKCIWLVCFFFARNGAFSTIRTTKCDRFISSYHDYLINYRKNNEVTHTQKRASRASWYSLARLRSLETVILAMSQRSVGRWFIGIFQSHPTRWIA